MDSITRPDLDPTAAVRRVLEAALGTPAAPEGHLYDRVQARFARIGGVALDVPPREKLRSPPSFD